MRAVNSADNVEMGLSYCYFLTKSGWLYGKKSQAVLICAE